MIIRQSLLSQVMLALDFKLQTLGHVGNDPVDHSTDEEHDVLNKNWPVKIVSFGAAVPMKQFLTSKHITNTNLMANIIQNAMV